MACVTSIVWLVLTIGLHLQQVNLKKNLVRNIAKNTFSNLTYIFHVYWFLFLSGSTTGWAYGLGLPE